MKTTLVIFLMLLIAFNSNGQVADICHIADTHRTLTSKEYWSCTPKERHLYVVQRYAQKHMKNKEEYHMKAMQYAEHYPRYKEDAYTGIIGGSLLTVAGIYGIYYVNDNSVSHATSPSGHSYSYPVPVNSGVVAICVGASAFGIVFTILGVHHLHKVRMTMEGNCITFPFHKNKKTHVVAP